jgi:cell division septal protein FtsQ
VTRLRRLVRLAALVLLAELIYVPLRSPRFAVTGLELRGDPHVAEEVATKLHLRANTNIFFAPAGAIARAAESVPSVKEASVSRDWSRHLVVTLERREAVAVIRGAKQALLVDASGVLFSIRNEWGWGLPELTAPRVSSGDTRSPEARAELSQLLSALRALGPNPQLRIARVAMDREGGLEVALDSGARVRLGSTDRLETKTKLLATVLSQLGPEKIEFLDLSDPLAAYWRERSSGKPAPKPER